MTERARASMTGEGEHGYDGGNAQSGVGAELSEIPAASAGMTDLFAGMTELLARAGRGARAQAAGLRPRLRYSPASQSTVPRSMLKSIEPEFSRPSVSP